MQSPIEIYENVTLNQFPKNIDNTTTEKTTTSSHPLACFCCVHFALLADHHVLSVLSSYNVRTKRIRF